MARNEYSILSSAQNENNHNNERLCILETKINKNDRIVGNHLPDSFACMLKKVKAMDTTNLTAKITFKAANKQANPMIAWLILTGSADIIMSNDSDFSVYCGDKCLCIKSFKFDHREKKISEMVLSTGDRRVANDVSTILCTTLDAFGSSDNIFTTPKFPLYCGEEDPMICMLMSVAVGCDVYPGGIELCGPSKIYKMMTAL